MAYCLGDKMEGSVIVVQTNIDTSTILESLSKNKDDWNVTSKKDRVKITGLEDDFNFLPLINPKISKNERIFDVDRHVETELFNNYPEVKQFFKYYNIKKPARSAFYRLGLRKTIEIHRDRGKYFINKDRYYLSVKSTFHFYIGESIIKIDPGTFFWVDNTIPSGIVNIDRDECVFLKFDAYPNKNNPHHLIL